MFYPKNNTSALSTELFENPTAEYRGAPFWAWNCKLDKATLLNQIETFKKMGFGGFHMHARSGLGTPYLSDEFMDYIKLCRSKAEQENMLAWLYDEDRYPSGFAGGMVTKNKRFRAKMLYFSEEKPVFLPKETALETGAPYFVAAFDIKLNKDGTIAGYKRIGEIKTAKHIKRYAYVQAVAEDGWWNGQTYVDAMCDEAIREFINITYEAYRKSVGDSFGKSVPAIFTDEPQVSRKGHLPFSSSHTTVKMPWTADFESSYQAAYGEDITDFIPELFWDLPEGKLSAHRYRYHAHISTRFVSAFAKQCGSWCAEHGLALTGHLMGEAELESQTAVLSEAMPSYAYFQIPGIDMLCDRVELTTAKQAQSVVHQYGKEAMVSELYGVTGWDFDFRGHKFQGDWQAALGVTVRVPHLSWMSMKGAAKRDYPASVNHQSPWYDSYSYVENHFARLNTALTRGKPQVRVGVIHPVESYWLHFSAEDTGGEIREQAESRFQNLTRWLLNGLIDFDFISETLLPDQCVKITDKLQVGCMEYSTVVVPGCETLRKTTFRFLKEFKDKGGKLIFMGECPKYIDGTESDAVTALYRQSTAVPFEKLAILKALSAEKQLEIRYADGKTAENLIHTRRTDGDKEWLFIAHSTRPDREEADLAAPENLCIVLNGAYMPVIYDTLSGKTEIPEYEVCDGKTYIKRTIYAFDSLLLQLSNGIGKQEISAVTPVFVPAYLKNTGYKRLEENVLVLDMAEYRLDDGSWQPAEEMLRIDTACRQLLGYPKADGRGVQPWLLEEEKTAHFVSLKFCINSNVALSGIYLAAEEAVSIYMNGTKIKLTASGCYIDQAILKYALGTVQKGENILEVTVPITRRISLENMFLLGEFDVSVRGLEKVLLPPAKVLNFGDITHQGLPFYGGNLQYETEVELPAKAALRICCSRYRGAAVKVYIDEKPLSLIAYPPYIAETEVLSAGKHKITFELLGNRANTFGPLHRWATDNYYRPNGWFTQGNEWSYEYHLTPTGILAAPTVEITF